MAETSIYKADIKPDHIERLYQILSLAKVGAASTETLLDIAHMDSAHCNLFEAIYKLASEAVELAESDGKA